jgi:hypothetical protein
MISVVDDVDTPFYHFLESPGHGLHQVLEISGVLHLDNPQLQDLFLQLLNVAGGGALQLHLLPGTHIFNGVGVRTVSRPFDELNVGLPSKPVAQCSVLKEMRCPMLIHEEIQLVLKDVCTWSCSSFHQA